MKRRPRGEAEGKIISFLRNSGVVHLTEIVEKTGVPWATVYNNIQRLWIEGKVEKFSEADFRDVKQGRPKVYWMLNV